MIDNIVYDTRFNGNEWFVIALIVVFFSAIRLFPRRFSPLQATFNFLIGIAFALLFDHTIGVPPFDLYDVGDQAKYQFFDLFSYLMYAPFGYWFMYGYERLRMFGWMTIVYILVWTALGLGIETIGVRLGVYHYKNGYGAIYSIPIYALVMSLHLALYRAAFGRRRWRRRASEGRG